MNLVITSQPKSWCWFRHPVEDRWLSGLPTLCGQMGNRELSLTESNVLLAKPDCNLSDGVISLLQIRGDRVKKKSELMS